MLQKLHYIKLLRFLVALLRYIQFYYFFQAISAYYYPYFVCQEQKPVHSVLPFSEGLYLGCSIHKQYIRDSFYQCILDANFTLVPYRDLEHLCLQKDCLILPTRLVFMGIASIDFSSLVLHSQNSIIIHVCFSIAW